METHETQMNSKISTTSVESSTANVLCCFAFISNWKRFRIGNFHVSLHLASLATYTHIAVLRRPPRRCDAGVWFLNPRSAHTSERACVREWGARVWPFVSSCLLSSITFQSFNEFNRHDFRTIISQNSELRWAKNHGPLMTLWNFNLIFSVSVCVVSRLLSANWIYARWFDVAFVCVSHGIHQRIHLDEWTVGWMDGWHVDVRRISNYWCWSSSSASHKININIATRHTPRTHYALEMDEWSRQWDDTDMDPTCSIHRAHRAFVSCASFRAKIS